MKIKTVFDKHCRLVFPAILCMACVPINSCTTGTTATMVTTQPMNSDLEKKVLNETGLSGMFIGAAAGAAAGAVLNGVLAKLAGGDTNQVRTAAVEGAVVGGTLGACAGWQKGHAEGGRIVANAMDRDHLSKLLMGAKAQNRYLASYNAGLRDQIAKASRNPDPKERKAAYAGLRDEGNKQLKKTDSRIAMRDKALNNKEWVSNQKLAYRSERNDMVAKRSELVASINKASRLEQEVVF
jgi:hypothetical protein